MVAGGCRNRRAGGSRVRVARPRRGVNRRAPRPLSGAEAPAAATTTPDGPGPSLLMPVMNSADRSRRAITGTVAAIGIAHSTRNTRLGSRRRHEQACRDFMLQRNREDLQGMNDGFRRFGRSVAQDAGDQGPNIKVEGGLDATDVFRLE